MVAQLVIVPAFRHRRRRYKSQYATYWQYRTLTFFFFRGTPACRTHTEVTQ